MELRLQSVEQDGVLKEKTHLTSSMRRVKHTIFHSGTMYIHMTSALRGGRELANL